jgi:hypothetical protein
MWLRLKSFANINSVEHILKTANDFSLNQETIKAFEAARMYFEYLHDQQKEDVIHNLLRQDIIKIKPDTLILDISPSMTNLARFEIESVGLDWNYMNQNFQDHRRCHLTKRNNEILAEKMHQWIDTGIAISLEVKDFEVPSREEIELLFGMDKK